MVKKSFLLVILIVIMALFVQVISYGYDYSNHWANNTIEEWIGSGRISGYEDGSFKPDNPVTRAEFMTMVNNAYGFDSKEKITYVDVDSGKWYYDEIQKAVKAGYILGDGETVRPEDNVSRQEVAIIITRLNNLKENVNVSMFKDKHYIAEWAVGSVGAVAYEKIMIGNDNNNFCPGDAITRAEALVTLDRTLKSCAFINELSIEEAELDQTFNIAKTNYTAKGSGAENITLIADVNENINVEFKSNFKGNIIVTKAVANDGKKVFIAKIPISNLNDAVITIKVTAEGLIDKKYEIIIK